tara:strand:+ start:610 stop:897 length:288 start_codon:yes stop_codon:yes gene_type:complete
MKQLALTLLDKVTILEGLGSQVFSVIFTKKDGTERTMLAKIIPSDVHNIHNDNLIRVMDVNLKRKYKDINKSWRQFDINDIRKIKCHGQVYNFLK